MDKDEDLNPHDLIKKHIEDKEHTVTDEELQNIKVGEDAIPDEELEKGIKEKEDELKHKPHLPNPYDVL